MPQFQQDSLLLSSYWCRDFFKKSKSRRHLTVIINFSINNIYIYSMLIKIHSKKEKGGINWGFKCLKGSKFMNFHLAPCSVGRAAASYADALVLNPKCQIVSLFCCILSSMPSRWIIDRLNFKEGLHNLIMLIPKYIKMKQIIISEKQSTIKKKKM